MKKMQSGYLKIVAIIILSFIFAEPAVSQVSSFRLKTADSLFSARRYTQSLEHYREVLRQKQYTPAMLLRMAYIEEGLLHIGQAMYYLNLYYLATNDESALDKMNELAEKHNLEGYQVQDGNFETFYRQYHLYISLSLFALIIFFFSIALFTRVRLKRRPVIAFSFLTGFALVFAVHLYFKTDAPTGIVTNPETYVMSGPSAGASVLEIIGDGHKVEIVGTKDVWLKIRWNNEIAYVRQNTLQPVRL